MFNQVTIVGNVGSCEMRFTPNGVPVCAISIASNKKYNDAQGNKQETTVWFRVTLWRKAAESAGEHVKKGMKVLVLGEFDQAPRVYQDKQGNHVASLEVTGQTWKIIDWGDKGDARNESVGDVRIADEAAIPF